MSGPSPLQRSSWKAEAIRRGDLKISGPIPITEDMPLNEEEEKEFAEKGGLDASLQSQDEPEEEQRPRTPEQPLQPPPSIPEPPSALRSNPVEVVSSPRETLHERQPSRSPPRVRQVNDIARESVIQPSSYTAPTPLRSTPESTTKAAQKKKRKSGLRGVFRKMFGRKTRDEHEEQEQEAARRGHSYHHSDPGMLRRSAPKEQKSNGTRISDLPIEELKPLHPLGQHLPFPMNVNAPQASPPQEYLTFDMQRPDIGRRRATLPTVPSAGTHRHSLDESRGRLSTWEERQDEEPEPSPGIGIALSSPTQATTPRQSKRRSRSADALRELVKSHVPLDRRRSAEIRYWRESYMSGSVYSRPQTAKTVETFRSVQMQEPNIQEPEPDSVIEMSATLVEADEPETPELEHVGQEQGTERVIQPPVSAFNFGALKKAPEPQLEALPPAPPPRSDQRPEQRPSVEDRMQHLESKVENMEFSVRRLSTRNNRQTIILENAPKNLRTRNRSSSSRSASASRSRSTPSIHQEPNHQSSSDTLNPGPASPVLTHISAAATSDGEEASKQALKTMYEALKYERSARKALEQQVLTLQHDISDLHALVNKLIASATATSPSYPTPSPDTLVTSTEERLLTPRALRTGSFDEAYAAAQGKRDVGGRRESVDSTEESERGFGASGKSSYDELATPDVWATPKEEGFGASGFFSPHHHHQQPREQGVREDGLKSYA
ncbi:hypothetical protein N0V83_001522 [Neocucurbitaria cava]|uniref:Uncharacterized protein n=1 Tax=Neocucurbitaria cava TaxID=798079 RepID=A0A9W9CRB4_9PLEO|nr:hypothetical protein N0V83_001522 [Neocucurbitaria cava]